MGGVNNFWSLVYSDKFYIKDTSTYIERDVSNNLSFTDAVTGTKTLAELLGGGSMVYPSFGIALSTGSAWGTSIIDNSATWNAAQPGHTNLTSLAGLSYVSTSFIKMTGVNIFSLDTNAYSLSSHTHTFASLTSKPTTFSGYGISDTFVNLNTAINDATLITTADSRLSDARTPVAHAMDSATYHTSSDVTTLNATTSKHGFLFKLGGGTTNYLRADGAWATPPGTIVSFGADNQIPTMNGTTDFDYSVNLIFTGTQFYINAYTGIGIAASTDYKLIVNSSDAAKYTTSIINTSITGYGLVIGLGAETEFSLYGINVFDSAGSVFQVRGNGYIGVGTTANSSYAIYANGEIYSISNMRAVDFIQTSDIRLKTSISKIENGLDIVLGLEPKIFRDRKSTRLNSSHIPLSRMPSSA